MPDAYNVVEADTNVAVTVTRTGGCAGTVQVNYATSDVTATAGADYDNASGVLQFPEGVTSQTFNVHIRDDILAETPNPETLNIT
jgi:hypothetical protein